MSEDSKYSPFRFIFKSRGIVARPVSDRSPENTFLNLNSAEEREENAMSTRLGSQIINRDSQLAGTANYYFNSAGTTISRLKALSGQTYRYLGLASGDLVRRSGDAQGVFTTIRMGMSGKPFSTVVQSLFQSTKPYLLIADSRQMLKDSGIGSPTQWGIFPPTQPANATQYAPSFLVIEGFQASSGFSTSGITVTGTGTITTVNGANGVSTLNYEEYQCTDGSFIGTQTGMIGSSSALGADGQLRLIFNSTTHPGTMFGPAVAATGVNVAPGFNWVNPGNVSSNVGFATVALNINAGVASARLYCTNFTFVSGLVAPSGIQVTCNASSTVAGQPVYALLLKNGVTVGVAKSAPMSNAHGQLVFGGVKDLWGTSFLASDIYNVNFGVAFYVLHAGKFSSISLNNVQMKVFSGNQTFDIYSGSGSYASGDSFAFKDVTTSIPSSTTGTIGKTTAMNLSSYEDDDLFVLILAVSSPAAIQEIRLQFDVNGSGYSSSYYYKSIIPASYQSGISLPQTSDPSQSVNNAVFARASGIKNLSEIGKDYAQIIPIDDPSIGQLQPSTITTGAGSWSVLYLRKGEFVPVGNAGSVGLDWANITGWQVQITTNTQGSSAVNFNALYIQGGYGPSSFGGIGYDYRYTGYNANTGTESNPSGEQYFNTTTGVSSLVVLRQPIDVEGQYLSDPQVTHVRVYRRGGTFGSNWFLLDQFPNIAGSTLWQYKDVFDDSVLAQAPTLNLANDVPVTSTLQNPIVTTLQGALNPFPPSPPNQPWAPLTVAVADASAVFVPFQVVDIGTPENLEQVMVITGGVGQFTAVLQLPHIAGEPVNVFAIPAQPCNLAAIAYNLVWLAGDVNNPNALYYSNPSYPESFSPAQRIQVGAAGDPIMAVINFRGALFVATVTTWYQIFPGTLPYAQPTGSKHGLAAQFGWTQTESAIWYRSIDGVREFRGADGNYESAPIEWLFQNQNQQLTPIVEADLSQLANDKMSFHNNVVFHAYMGLDGLIHRLMYNTTYKRWRNDDVHATAMNLEADTNVLLVAKQLASGGYVVVQDRIGDYDDGGWVGGQLVQTPISFNIQIPYQDQEMPNNQKQFNQLTLDMNPNGQNIVVQLLFDDNNGVVAPITFAPVTGPIRKKFEFTINSGFGQQAYRTSLVITGAVTVAPIIYQAELNAALLAVQRQSFDTYWVKFGTDESDILKQGYFDYTSLAIITVSLYADGNMMPYYVFTLPANPNRSQVPVRIRFPAKTMRLFRMIATSTDNFQMWQAPQVDTKPLLAEGAKGYSRTELNTI